MKKSRLLCLVLCLIMLVGCFGTPVSAIISLDGSGQTEKDPILWELDFASMDDVIDNKDSSEYTITASPQLHMTDFDGQECLAIEKNYGHYFIEDTEVALKDYDAFFIEADMYFESFPSGSHDGKTPYEYPMSFMTWITDTERNAPFYGSIRVDNEGYLCTGGKPGTRMSDTAKLPLGEWFNIRFAVSPSGGLCEVFINHESVGSYNVAMVSPLSDITVSRVRFFDTRYNYTVYFKNISVTSDSEYRIGLAREESAKYIGCQTTKVTDGSFDVRFLAGVDSLDYNSAGFDVITIFEEFEDVTTYDDENSSKTVYESVNVTRADGSKSAIKASDYGSKYITAFTLPDVRVNQGKTQFLVRPFIVKNGLRIYAEPLTVTFTGEVRNGMPVFIGGTASDEYSLTAAEDTYVGGKYQNSADQTPHGNDAVIDIRNAGPLESASTRLVFLKFHLSDAVKEAVKSTDKVYLEMYGYKFTPTDSEAKIGGIQATVSAVDTKWSEDTLTKDLIDSEAATIEKLGNFRYVANSYCSFDVTDYINRSLDKNEIAFRIENAINDGTRECTFYSTECGGGTNAPRLHFVNSDFKLNYELDLNKIQNSGYEPWGFAEKIVKEWFDTDRDKVYGDTYSSLGLTAVENSSGSGDYKTLNPIIGQQNSHQYVRLLSDLSGFEKKNGTEYDEYYGITNLGIEGEATGFFHTETIDGRSYLIDPLGNPYYAVGVNTVELGATTNQRNASLKKYGSADGFFLKLTKEFHEDFGINTVVGSDLAFGDFGMNYITAPGCNIAGYMSVYGLGTSTGGSSSYLYNNTMNVFDPDFVKYSMTSAEAGAGTMKDDPCLIGYTTDNELPAGNDILSRYLTIDCYEPVNAFSYATAWTYLKVATGNPNPSVDDATGDLATEFLGFVYNRYFKVMKEAIKAADPNHMYIGTRCNHPNDEGYLRALALYCDIMTVNLYGEQNYTVINNTIETMHKYTGLPFLVTEFGMRARDSYDMNGIKLGNFGGTATWLFETQQQRANSYESYVLNLLQSNNCVGWTLYRFRDNDQTIYSDAKENHYVATQNSGYTVTQYKNIETGELFGANDIVVYQWYVGEIDTSNLCHNKGIYDNKMDPYIEMQTSIKRISDAMTDLVLFFGK